jgi:hypothetical protein
VALPRVDDIEHLDAEIERLRPYATEYAQLQQVRPVVAAAAEALRTGAAPPGLGLTRAGARAYRRRLQLVGTVAAYPGCTVRQLAHAWDVNLNTAYQTVRQAIDAGVVVKIRARLYLSGQAVDGRRR